MPAQFGLLPQYCTLANLAICYEFAKVLSEKAIEAGLKSAKVFFAKCNLACNSLKFSPAKIFRYTVVDKMLSKDPYN